MAARKKTNKNRQLWAYTQLSQYGILIYKNSDPKFIETYHGEMHGPKNIHCKYTIDIAAEVFNKPALFNETLIHEFVHVLETIWSADHFNPKRVNGCSTLARTIGAGIGEMLTKLTQV